MVRRKLVCFDSSFAYESAPNISHATLDGERTLCGRRDWATEDPWCDIGPDCLRCAAILARRMDPARKSTTGKALPPARRDGNMMLGPTLMTRCPDHKSRWITYREVWRVEDGDEEIGRCEAEDVILRPCAECLAQHEAEERETLRLYDCVDDGGLVGGSSADLPSQRKVHG